MEKKNMVLLTVIAIATLLVAVVGATFAYFTATATPQGEGAGSKADITTAKLDGANVTFEGGNQLEMLTYPGGLAVYEGKATIEKQKPEDTNHYEATFNLKIEYINETDTDLTWELYMVAQEYEGLNAAEETTCELKQKQVGSQVQLWYADKNDDDADPSSDSGCDGEAITQAINKLNPTKIASGKFLKQKSIKTTIDKTTLTQPEISGGTQEDEGNLENRKINTQDTKTKYYYLVVKYPNDGNQSNDVGKKISAKLSIDGDIQLSLHKSN